MKPHKPFFIGAVALALGAFGFISGCKDGKGLGTFTANINGESWSAVAPTAAKTGNRITITGLSLDKQIVININGTSTGTYTMDVFSGSIQPFVYLPNVNQQGAQETYVGGSGNIVVTDINDTRLSGTFSITATNSTATSIGINGEFRDVKYF